MQKSAWPIIFLIVLAAHLLSIQQQFTLMASCTKPLLLLSLIAWFIKSTPHITGNFKQMILAALCLSLAGDVWLIFEKNNTSFFIFGLICFLAAHVFYALAFNRMRNNNAVAIKWWLAIFVAAFYFSLIYILFPHLGDMKIPVLFYGAVISMMLFVAIHFLFVKKPGAVFIVAGALLFITSDSLLAINKFYSPFLNASTYIMLTYAFAQYYIIKGVIQYLDAENKIDK
ncbi:MAG: lysoplasmalogenase [Ferruginibacter sp.]|nr:lysoplasmalogenase [Ferruginibacter sp.]